MKDERTDEQKEADTELERAVRKCAEAYYGSGFVTEYAVCAHQFDASSTGEEQDNMLLMLPNGGVDMPIYRVLGLLAAGRLHAEDEFHEGGIDLDPNRS